MIKAIFFDIDGTLVSFKTHCVPDSAVKAIHALHKKGVRTFIASGRRSADIALVTLPPMDGYITLNGAVCLVGDTALCDKKISSRDIEGLIEYQESNSHAYPFVLVRPDGMYMDRPDRTIEDFYKAVNVPPPTILPWERWKELAREGVNQLLGFFPQAAEESIFPSVLRDSKAMRWTDIFADVVHVDASKSDGIDRICEHFGILRQETMSMGDGGNDIDMLRYTAVGVAMGQASQQVKDAADYVTSAVDEDGVLNALLHLGVLTPEDIED